MVRIINKELPENKNIKTALTYIYGVGDSLAQQVLEKLSINPLLKTKDLTDEQTSLISQELRQFKLEDDLKQNIEQNIEQSKTIRCRKGKLHDKNKKVRGQRTHSNNRTRPDGIKSITVRAVAVAGKKAPKQQG